MVIWGIAVEWFSRRIRCEMYLIAWYLRLNWFETTNKEILKYRNNIEIFVIL